MNIAKLYFSLNALAIISNSAAPMNCICRELTENSLAQTRQCLPEAPERSARIDTAVGDYQCICYRDLQSQGASVHFHGSLTPVGTCDELVRDLGLIQNIADTDQTDQGNMVKTFEVVYGVP